jgi:hypothetical protein
MTQVLATFCGAVAITLFFVIPTTAARFGSDVGARFLEKGAAHDAETLRAWVTSHPREAAGYRVPVLFPLDFVFALALGGFLTFGSMTDLTRAQLATHAWLVSVIPLAYTLADIIEDALLIYLLGAADAITPTVASALLAITRVKIVAAGVGLLQVLVVSAATLWARRS